MLQVQSKYASTIFSNFKYAEYTIYNDVFAYAFAHKKNGSTQPKDTATKKENAGLF
jgi:hypothetical protein